MKTGHTFPFCGLALVGLIALAAPAAAGQAAPGEPTETRATSTPGPGAGDGAPEASDPGPTGDGAQAARAASWVTVDAETGERRPVRPGEAGRMPLSPRLQEWLSRRTDDLYEEVLPAGGFAVDLKGRFRNLTVVRIGDDGEIETRCLDRVPPGSPTGDAGADAAAAGERGDAEHDHE